MTPAGKAKELYDKFSIYTSTGDEDDDFGEYKKANKYFNKNACLLCVDEIIKANPTKENYSVFDELSDVEYWQQVKEELQKL
jgi:hypothetical protein